MLEGLEATEIRLHECIENKDYRIDSAFYTKAPITNPNLDYKRIGDCLITSQYGISIAMNESGIGYPIYRMNEIHNQLCDLDVNKCADITPTELEIFKLYDGDVIFNRTNSFEWVGRTGIYYQNDDIDRVFASYLVRFIPDDKLLLPEYLTTYLNTKYGVWDIKRRARQSINQTNVNPEEVKEMEIPLLSMDIQNCVVNNLQIANKKRITAHKLYSSAETYLLECLGMTDFTANPEAYNVKSLKESFLETGRFDSEYYLPKYEDYCRLIQSYPNGYGKVGDFFTHIKDNFITTSEICKYIEIGNIDVNNGEITYNDINVDELPANAKIKVKKDDVLISTVRPNRGAIAIITREGDDMVASGAFTVLREQDSIKKEVLQVLLRTGFYKDWLLQANTGCSYPVIKDEDILNFPIPIIRKEVQEEIAKHIQKSFTLRKEAQQLLENAKLTVERAIEMGEKIINIQ